VAERAILAGGRAYLLPPGAEAMAPAPMSPLPLSAAGLLGTAVLGSAALPVFALAPGPVAIWAHLRDSGVVLAGETLLDPAPPDAEPLPPLRAAGRPPPAMRAVGGGAWSVPARGSQGLPRTLAVETGAARLVLPFAALEHLEPMPPLRPAPGAEGVALGYALSGGAPVLVLNPGLFGAEIVEAAPLLLLFRHAGRRLGLPCQRVQPARPGEATLAERLDALLPRLGAAPLGAAPPPPLPEPSRAVLVCTAGGQPFALPVEEVTAVIPPLVPGPAPRGLGPRFLGIAAHRGEVLPVLDAGLGLGLPPVLTTPGQEVPLLRLATPRPVALAVAAVTGLRRVPERLVSELAGAGPVAAIAAVGDAPLPICRAAVLGDPW
jgi:chemotaxis signal transduction protein